MPMRLAAELVKEHDEQNISISKEYFVEKLSEFLPTFDWSTNGPLKGYGGASGADAAFVVLNDLRMKKYVKKDYGKQKYFTY